MSDLKPWLRDDVPHEIGRLLRAERNYSPPRGAIDRAVLMVSSAATVGTATTSILGAVAKAGTANLGWVAKWGAATLLGIGLGTTAAVTMRHYSADTTQAVTTAPAKPKTRIPGGRALAPSVASESLTPPVEELSPSATQKRVVGSPPLPVELPHSSVPTRVNGGDADVLAIQRTVVPTVTGDHRASSLAPSAAPMPQQNTQEDLRLAEEMRYLDQVRGALRQSRPADALKWLTAYQRNCSAQRMLPEALLLRLRAEVSSGNRLAALATAQQIGSRFPKSPHAARAKELLALAHFE